MTDPGEKLSSDHSKVKPRYTVVVVGSGYGGAIVASRMARAGQSVCLLERGAETRPGSYPNTLANVLEQTRVTVNGDVTQRDGMFDLRVDDDVSVLVGCGLGGTSLINANVALQADPRVFAADVWPQALRAPGVLDPYYKRARQWLGSTPYPDNYPQLRKVDALNESAAALKRDAILPPINVNFQALPSGKNPYDVPQSPCVLCGDCVTGCNYGAKNTTLMNYLPDAKAHGADIFTNAKVLFVVAGEDGSFKVVIESAPGADFSIACDVVVLAAGTLGSTEILLRSAKNGLQTSNRLGKGFSCNGDMLAWGYNNDRHADAATHGNRSPLPLALAGSMVNDADQRPEVYGVGGGAQELPARISPGPCIAGCIDMRDSAAFKDGLVVQEGVIPGAFAPMVAPTFLFAAARNENFFEYSDTSTRLQDAQEVADSILNSPAQLAELAYKGAMARTQSYLVMSHDSAGGTMSLDPVTDALRVTWPGAGREKVYAHDEHILRKVNRAVRGTYIPNPISSPAFGERVVTVHPLGGCGMADSGTAGVVNDKCQVFCDSSDSKKVYKNLYVCDGSVMPGALGVNPLLTISAIAERACDLMASDRNWKIDMPAQPPYPDPPLPPSSPWQDTRPLPGATVAPAPAAAPAEGLLGRVRDGIERLVTSLGSSAAAGATTASSAASIISLNPVGDVGSAVEKDIASSIGQEIQRLEDDLQTMLPGSDPGKAAAAKADLIALITKWADEFPEIFSPRLSFTERMVGFFSTQALPPTQPHALRVADPFEIARQYGVAENNSMVALLTIAADPLSTFTDNAPHVATLTGTVTCKALSNSDLKVTNGTFSLFPPDPNRVETWNMLYSMDLDGAGVPYHFEGHKILHQRPGSNWWKDVTTLFVTVSQKDTSGNSTVVGRGIIELGLDDLVHQAASVHPQHGKVLTDIRTALGGWFSAVKSNFKDLEDDLNLYFGAKFAGFCAQTVFRAYGGLLSDLADFAGQEDRGRVPRSLQAPSPMVHSFLTDDRAELQLTRYHDEKNAANGPVILAPGFGVRASSFAIDTVDTNLVEYLTKNGFDVWLFDYRASPTLTDRTAPFTIDEIALHDWPAAVNYVYNVAGSKKPAVLAHCVGSMTFLMALLRNAGGIKDKVQSGICSQITLHPVTNWLNHLKSDLGVVRLLEEYFDVREIDLRSSASAASKAMDTWLWNVPVPEGEECANPVCRRVFAVYGPSYAHDQLNAATHTALREMFGKIHGKPFEQMVQIVRKARVVDNKGRDTYVTPENAKNLNLPLMFVAGSRNQIFEPETSQLTLAWLNNVNPTWTKQYQRQVFPGYAHMDLFIGKSAATEGIYQFFVDTLKAQATAGK